MTTSPKQLYDFIKNIGPYYDMDVSEDERNSRERLCTEYIDKIKSEWETNIIGHKIEEVIRLKVHEILNKSKDVSLPDDIIETDNIGEVIEKLAILHCRMWYLEDEVAVETDDHKIAELKRKIDICFKQKRPKYVEAINRMLDEAIRENKPLTEESVKLYKNFQK